MSRVSRSKDLSELKSNIHGMHSMTEIQDVISTLLDVIESQNNNIDLLATHIEELQKRYDQRFIGEGI